MPRTHALTHSLAHGTSITKVANSGILGGSFMARDSYINLKTGQPFIPSDIYHGATIRIQGQAPFVVTEVDNNSLSFCEEHPEQFPYSSMERIVRKVVDRIVTAQIDLRRDFKQHDPTNCGYVQTKEVFMQVLAESNVSSVLKPPELKTLYRRFAEMTDDVEPPVDQRRICYQDFCDMAAYIHAVEYEGSGEEGTSAKDRFVLFLRTLRNSVMNDVNVMQQADAPTKEAMQACFASGAKWLSKNQDKTAAEYDEEREKYETMMAPIVSRLMMDVYGREFGSFGAIHHATGVHHKYMRELCLTKVAWRATFRMLDTESTGVVSMADVAKSFTEWGVELSQAGRQIIETDYGSKGSDGVDYTTFCDNIYMCDFADHSLAHPELFPSSPKRS